MKSTGLDEPGVMATLSFGALSGSIGAASVYREFPPTTQFSRASPHFHPHPRLGSTPPTPRSYGQDSEIQKIQYTRPTPSLHTSLSTYVNPRSLMAD